MEWLDEFTGTLSMQALIISGLRILLVLVLIWLATWAIKLLLGRLEVLLIAKGKEQGDIPSEARKRAETLVRLLRQAVIILLWIMALLIILNELGVEITPILASAGIAGLALGFGAQNLVRDIIAGFFIILENQVRVGDVALINGTGGLVEMVNFRTIILRDLSGIVHVFPNGTITTLSNLTRDWSGYVFDIRIDYREDADRVMQLMRGVGEELRQDAYYGPLMVEDIEIFGVDDFTDSAILIKGRLRTKPIKQWEVGREFRRRLKLAFDQAGLAAPFPHRTLHLGNREMQEFMQLLQQQR